MVPLCKPPIFLRTRLRDGRWPIHTAGLGLDDMTVGGLESKTSQLCSAAELAEIFVHIADREQTSSRTCSQVAGLGHAWHAARLAR